MFGFVSYVLLAAGEKQPWATEDVKEFSGISNSDVSHPKQTDAEEDVY